MEGEGTVPSMPFIDQFVNEVLKVFHGAEGRSRTFTARRRWFYRPVSVQLLNPDLLNQFILMVQEWGE